MSLNSFQTKDTLKVSHKNYTFYNLSKLSWTRSLPRSLKVLLENLLRHENGVDIQKDDILAFEMWLKHKKLDHEIAFFPARVLMQDFTGVPAVVDLAAMRDAMAHLKKDPQKINPLIPVDLVIDHSVMVDHYASPDAFKQNVDLEYQRNKERYQFLKYGQKAFKNFRVVPPGTGICHQVNLEYLAKVVWSSPDNTTLYPDTLVGTDSHTTMINGLSVLGWGVGGIEAEAAMLGQGLSMTIPEVIGFKLSGTMREGTTATDLVLTITNILRSYGVVGKFVEFFGPGLNDLPLADRATIANMAPEYGATCGFFPIDDETLNYLRLSKRDDHLVEIVEQYAKANGFWRTDEDPEFTDVLHLDLSTVEPSLAGPKRPQDKILLSNVSASFSSLKTLSNPCLIDGMDHQLDHGDVVIAAITSCTNTSNPYVMMGAGLLAKKAVEKGLKVKPFVKTSLAPGSQVVTDYFAKAKLQPYLDQLGFNLVGYGCTTCIGNSGPLPAPVAKAVEQNDLTVAAVLSGNRNFEGRVNPHVKANYLASPMLVVAYAIAGSMKINFQTDPIGHDTHGKPVYLKDIWPSTKEIHDTVHTCVTSDMFQERYAHVFKGDPLWQSIESSDKMTFDWDSKSTYIKCPPYFEDMTLSPVQDLKGARLLAILGDSITTDHISPAGSIKANGPAGTYLNNLNVTKDDFNSYGARRGNHEVMVRGTFANIRLVNELAPDNPGGFTKHPETQAIVTLYDYAMEEMDKNVPLMILAGKEYGTGSSRDWAAKGTKLLGVKAVIAESFERIHRSNLVGMGILPVTFMNNMTRHDLALTGQEILDIEGIADDLSIHKSLVLKVHRPDGSVSEYPVMCRLDTEREIDYYRHGGILPYMLRQMSH